MMNKKGIELSINFIVVVILSIVILSIGLVLVRTFFAKTTEIKASLDDQTKSKITEMLSFGEITAMPFNKKQIFAGEYAVYGLGILNVEKQPKEFIVEVTANAAYDKANNLIVSFSPGVEQEWILYDEESFSLDAQEQKELSILVTVPKATVSGNYIFDVETLDITEGTRYGLNKIYIEVP